MKSYNPNAFMPIVNGLTSIVEEFLGKNLNDVSMQDFFTSQMPAVNIKENDQSFVIEVAAPGLEKSDFNIQLDKRLLTISSKKETVQSNDQEKFMRKEFNFKSFSRTFTLPESVNTDAIQANYDQGILKVNLPKATPAQKESKTINII